MRKIFIHGRREDIRRKALALAAVLSGRLADPTGIAKGFLLAVGFAVLSDVKDAFLVKSRGGTDEMGVTWPPLQPETIARRRVGPRDIKQSETIKKRQSIVRNLRRKRVKELTDRFSLSLPLEQAKQRAREIADSSSEKTSRQRQATQSTGLNKVATLGGRQVDMLRDTGVLLNSLSPGTIGPSDTYQRPSGDGGANQVFDLKENSITVGTNVPYAATHNFGDAERNIPRRQFLPDDANQVPQVWAQRWLDVATGALEVGIEHYFRSAA